MRRACRATGIGINRTPGRGVLVCSHFPNAHEIDCLPADSEFWPQSYTKNNPDLDGSWGYTALVCVLTLRLKQRSATAMRDGEEVE
jgi:hypothetical protein